jgi:hypothetical protein
VADYFNVDPIIVRIAAVVLLFTGPGFIAYVAAWIFVPAESGPGRFDGPPRPFDHKDRGAQIFGIVLLAIGVSVIWGGWWRPARGWLFPIGLMALGAWLLLRPDDDELPPIPPIPPTPPVPPWSAWSSPPAPVVTDAPGGAEDTTAVGPLASDDTAITDAPTEPLAGAGAGGDGSGAPPRAPWDVPPPPVPGSPSSWTPDEHRQRRHHQRPRRRHVIGPTVFGVLLVWTGLAALTDVGLTSWLAGALLVLGSGFVLGSFVGGSRVLILPSLLVAIALIAAVTIDIPLSGPVGEQRWSPGSVDELESLYDVSMGEGILDLTGVDVDEETTVRASVGLGHLVVLVADDQDVFVNTEVGAGEAMIFGVEQDGLGVETHEHYGDPDGQLILELEVGMGQIEVRRGEEPERGSTTSTTRELGRLLQG